MFLNKRSLHQGFDLCKERKTVKCMEKKVTEPCSWVGRLCASVVGRFRGLAASLLRCGRNSRGARQRHLISSHLTFTHRITTRNGEHALSFHFSSFRLMYLSLD
jgi:hypothetical protein